MEEEKRSRFLTDKPMTRPYSKPELLKLIVEVFTPSRAIKVANRDYFVGRTEKLGDCLNIITRPGAHIALCGNRGVGKTSLLNMVVDKCRENMQIYRAQCDSADTYESLWLRLFEDVRIEIEYEDEEDPHTEHDEDDKGNVRKVTSYTKIGLDRPLEDYEKFGSGEVLQALFAMDEEVLIVVDEFDVLSDKFDRRLFAETIKTITENYERATIIIVGVGDDAAALIGEHPSIIRNLIEVPLDEMTDGEIAGIIDTGCQALGMTIGLDVRDSIIECSCGFPSFTHLLCLHAFRNAVTQDRMNVLSRPDFDYAVKKSVQEADSTLRKSYNQATAGLNQALYEQILWAAMISPVDRDRMFQPEDVIASLGKIPSRLPADDLLISKSLESLCETERGVVMEMSGVNGGSRFKLRDPRMKAFLSLKYQEYKQLNSEPDLFSESK